MIEIRRMTEQEAPYASELAKVVWRSSIEPYCTDQQLRRLFDGYVEREAFMSRVQSGQLLLWGAFEDGHLFGVGGMQPEGHITMLYVLPAYQRRNIGKNLLAVMETYAYSERRLSRVTVSAMPAWTAPYFQKGRYLPMRQQGSTAFTFLEKKHGGPVTYRKRPISAREILALSFGTLGTVTLLSVIYAIYTLL